jgi:hypothetical protein
VNRLSNKQNIRLGGLIAVLGGREPYAKILETLVADGLVEHKDGKLVLSVKGVNEKDRLAILAGLMVEADYVAHRPRKLESINKTGEAG